MDWLQGKLRPMPRYGFAQLGLLLAVGVGWAALWVIRRPSGSEDSPLSAFYVLLLAAAFSFPAVAFGQTQPNVNNGFHPYGSYEGGGIDSVNLQNGNLILHVPMP